jgi:hypothetical protein
MRSRRSHAPVVAIGATLCVLLAAAYVLSYTGISVASSRGDVYVAYVRPAHGNTNVIKIQFLAGVGDQSPIGHPPLRIVISQHQEKWSNSQFFPAEMKPNWQAAGVRVWRGQSHASALPRQFSGPGPGPPGASVADHCVVAVPYLWVIAVVAIVPGLAGIAAVRRQRRERRGLCAN